MRRPTLAHGAIAPDPRLTVEIGKLNRSPVLHLGPAPCLGAYAKSTWGDGYIGAIQIASMPRSRT